MPLRGDKALKKIEQDWHQIWAKHQGSRVFAEMVLHEEPLPRIDDALWAEVLATYLAVMGMGADDLNPRCLLVAAGDFATRLLDLATCFERCPSFGG